MIGRSSRLALCMLALGTAFLFALDASPQVRGRSTGTCYCAVSRDHRPCGSCPLGSSGGITGTAPAPESEGAQGASEQAMHDANDRGVEFYNRGDWVNAIRAFEEALQIEPNDSAIIENLNRARSKARDADQQARIQREEQSKRAEQQRLLSEVDGRLVTTKAALARLKARDGRLQREIDAWVGLAEDARTEAQVAILDMAAALGMQFLRKNINRDQLMATGEDRRLVGVLPVVDGTPLQRWRADVIARLRAARRDADILDVLDRIGTSANVAAAVGGVYVEPKVLKNWINAVVGFIEPLVVKDPLLVLVLADARLAEPVLYGWAAAYAKKRALGDLATLGEAQYLEARNLARMYMNDLRRRNELLAAGAGRR